jgi:hypothetical protein
LICNSAGALIERSMKSMRPSTILSRVTRKLTPAFLLSAAPVRNLGNAMRSFLRLVSAVTFRSPSSLVMICNSGCTNVSELITKRPTRRCHKLMPSRNSFA